MLASHFPPAARVWIYQADRFLNPEEVTIVRQETENFLHSWTSHNAPLPATFVLKYDLFLVLIADEADVKAGGCSIDKSVHFIQALGTKINVNFMNRMLFAYRNDHEVKLAPRQEFESLVARGIVHDDTLVFNNLVDTAEALDTQWEVPFKLSWHKQLI